MGDDTSRGLYAKYNVERTDGKSAPGQKHSECRTFVLDIEHDEFAQLTIMFYAGLCQTKYPELAKDLIRIARMILKIKWEEEG